MALELIQSMPLRVDTLTHAHVFGHTIHLAEKFGLTTYNAAYLELSVRINAPLATLDKALSMAAQACQHSTVRSLKSRPQS